MKFSRVRPLPVFHPLTVSFETKEEVLAVLDALTASRIHSQKTKGFDIPHPAVNSLQSELSNCI